MQDTSKERHRQASLSSVSLYRQEVRSFTVALRPQRPQGLLGTGCQGRPPQLSHTSWPLWLSGAKQWDSQWCRAVGQSVVQSSGTVSGAEPEHQLPLESQSETRWSVVTKRMDDRYVLGFAPALRFLRSQILLQNHSDETINRGPPSVYACK